MKCSDRDFYFELRAELQQRGSSTLTTPSVEYYSLCCLLCRNKKYFFAEIRCLRSGAGVLAKKKEPSQKEVVIKNNTRIEKVSRHSLRDYVCP